MNNNYVDKTGAYTLAIHCDLNTAERLYEGICKIHAEYPYKCNAQQKQEKRNLVTLKVQIEQCLPPLQNNQQ